MTIDGLAISISGRLLRKAGVRDEPYECVRDAGAVIQKLKGRSDRPDLFTFVQDLTDREPRFSFYHELQTYAVLPVTTYDHWWKKQIHDKTRNLIRKAHKQGVEIRSVPLNDDFVWGVKAIYDECPVRQGKPFKHYQKDHATIKAELATFPDRSEFIGAFLGEELIGFAKLVTGNNVASFMHIISRIADRNKAPTNALVARAVEVCADRQIPYLHYGVWSSGGLGMFKENHAFVPHPVPRYFVPLTWKGQVMLKLGLHRPWTEYVPETLREHAVALRNRWNAFRYSQKAGKGAVAQLAERRG